MKLNILLGGHDTTNCYEIEKKTCISIQSDHAHNLYVYSIYDP